MKKQLLFSWTGWAPRHVTTKSGRRAQVHCSIVLPSKAEFKRVTGTGESQLRNYVTVWPTDDAGPNPVHQAAVANPGTMYWLDTVRHTHAENVILPYDDDYLYA